MAHLTHLHCDSCVFSNCNSRQGGCPVERCPNGCGVSLHRCKIDEHDQHTCLEARVPCVNAQYGCEEVLKRGSIVSHIEHCSASTVLCRFARDYLVHQNFCPHWYSMQYSLRKHCFHSPSRCSPCDEVVRRDEFSIHYQCFHLDVEEDMDRIVERCPMAIDGCTHGEVRLVPNPKGSSINYDGENDLFLIKPPEIIDTEAQPQASGSYAAKLQVQQELALYGYGDESEESLDVLGQLPAEILMKICEFLDSMSLWNLSQVNHYIRKACRDMAKRKGVVYQNWVVDEATNRWVLGPKRWSFSRVFSTIPFWSYTDAPAMGSHLMSCDHYRSSVVPYDLSSRWKLLDLSPK